MERSTLGATFWSLIFSCALFAYERFGIAGMLLSFLAGFVFVSGAMYDPDDESGRKPLLQNAEIALVFGLIQSAIYKVTLPSLWAGVASYVIVSVAIISATFAWEKFQQRNEKSKTI